MGACKKWVPPLLILPPPPRPGPPLLKKALVVPALATGTGGRSPHHRGWHLEGPCLLLGGGTRISMSAYRAGTWGRCGWAVFGVGAAPAFGTLAGTVPTLVVGTWGRRTCIGGTHLRCCVCWGPLNRTTGPPLKAAACGRIACIETDNWGRDCSAKFPSKVHRQSGGRENRSPQAPATGNGC